MHPQPGEIFSNSLTTYLAAALSKNVLKTYALKFVSVDKQNITTSGESDFVATKT
jgi:hypothetical protein